MMSLKKLYEWMGAQVHTPFAEPFLALFSFLESIIFPPVAPILVLFCIENRRKSFIYAAIATLFSVLGGVGAYYIGYALWELIGHKLINWFTTPTAFNDLIHSYDVYQSWAIIVGSFAPVPYKAIGITAGFCKLSLTPFILCSLIGRGARYCAAAAVLYLWGPWFKLFIDRWFNQLVLLFVLMMSCGTLLLFVY